MDLVTGEKGEEENKFIFLSQNLLVFKKKPTYIVVQLYHLLSKTNI